MTIYKCTPHGNEVEPNKKDGKACGECLLNYLKWFKNLKKEDKEKEFKEIKNAGN